MKSFFLNQCHDIPSGHHGFQKTLSRLQSQVYWVGMASDAQAYCESCDKCHSSKDSLPPRIPLTNMPIGGPWEMVAMDILKLPISSKGNQYLLVVQDYFTKWLEAVPLRDQTADTVVTALIKIFSVYGIPKYLHSDQGSNFESTLLRETCKAFGIQKTRTTAYHPQGDGLVERTNRSIIQMLRSYTTSSKGDWDKWLSLLLYAYRTSQHSSTKFSPFSLMFGRDTPSFHTSTSKCIGYDTTTYSSILQKCLAEMYDIAEANQIQEAEKQKKYYDNGTKSRHSFDVGSAVWLSIPSSTVNKLDGRWEGGWAVTKLFPNDCTLQIQHTDGREKVVHMNRLRLRVIREGTQPHYHGTPSSSWEDPPFHHEITEADSHESHNETDRTADSHPESDADTGDINHPRQPTLRRSQRNHTQPDRYGTFVNH